MCETALPLAPHPQERQDLNPPRPLQAICVGRLVYWKGVRLAIRGFERFSMLGGAGNLSIVGDGPCYSQLKDYCARQALGALIHFCGHVAYQEVHALVQDCDALVHLSFRDGGSWAVLEAMQLGKPVICLDRSGLADIVTDRCGIRIDASDEEAVVQGLADALLHLSEGRDVLRRLGIGAAERIRDAYTWETRKNYLSKIYEQVLEEA